MDEFDERKNTGRVVVAVPTATEPIHHLGDAAEPKHLTVLWLGSPEENPDLDMDAVADAVRLGAEQAGPLTARVKEQGPLGEDGAQVAFLDPAEPTALRDLLLGDAVLKAGVDAVEQHPAFTPHVTLGYSAQDAVSDEELPSEVIFDRLALWDGDEHTEFPLGPSASSADTTDVMEGTPAPEFSANDDDFVDELLVTMTRPLVDPPAGSDPLKVSDISSLTVACAYADTLADDTVRAATRRVLTRRARMLGAQHVIPASWLRHATAAVTRVVNDAAARSSIDVPSVFARKTELSHISDTALRAAYMRGVREYTMTAPQSRPPLPRDVFAHARVNSLIRLSQGDLTARTDDQDLLR